MKNNICSSDAKALQERAANAKFVFYSFSGGRDSALAMYLTLQKFRQLGKVIAAIFVDSGDELPGLSEHVKNVCDWLGVNLVVLNGATFAELYGKNQRFPDSIHMDCIERLINKPMDKYMTAYTNGEDYVLVRGGRSDQKRPESGTKLYQTVKGKPNMIIYNPLYEYDPTDVGEEALERLTWEGYKKGFVRTACFCCPFQKPQQWEALKEIFPALHEKLKRMFTTYTFVLHPGDGHVRYISDYWIKKEFTPVKFEYAPKRREMMMSDQTMADT